MLVTNSVKNQPKPSSRPNKIGLCSSWATSLTFLSWLILLSIQQILGDPEFRASDMEMKVPCPQGVHGPWEGQIHSPVQCWMLWLGQRRVPSQPTFPEEIRLSLGAFTSRKCVIHCCSVLTWGSSCPPPLCHRTWVVCLISNPHHSCALELDWKWQRWYPGFLRWSCLENYTR